MVAGLSGGLLLAAPLAGLVSSGWKIDTRAIPNPFTAWANTDQDLLVLGSDVGGGNTDVMLTLRVADGHTTITQVPRDTYINSPRFGPIKANALYAYGGTDAVKEELSHRLGRPIGHHLLINLGAIRRMGDVLGGVEVNVPKRMYYVDNSQGLYIDLQPGVQTLKGRDLEGFLRWRHDEAGDIGRIDRQKLVLSALFAKLTRPENLVRLPSLLAAAGDDVKTDLGPMQIGGLITAMAATNLSTERIGGRPFDQNGISYWEADWPAVSTDSSSSGDGASEGRYRFLF
ncbi:LCP family protein [Synechococcus sp. CS-1325]|uniref:LCP family protein n=1 Tax=unclassified Synechococcus TaxID=2626047 RepID=UPI000DB6F19B|nr:MULTISPECIES: LCP family protein [unclassified Synechococcus]PZV01605.1 MAG: transcriptional regulator [Cyanobium sp.]MCT0200262.1 LCP family protein [Synechococcus sp. CS-1325]MCT0214275.1 LCP family protein [Synechococcus sp. CS-1326]MCT0230197.1 LCP family protein [Synechococcus sp. CS-1324]MCT0234439.1 LCP family protein [Synechococcus sp. CS-1327]